MKPPRLCRNTDGRAFIYHRLIPNKGHRLWVGKWGSDESLARFEEYIGRLREHQQDETVPVHRHMTIAELSVKYLEFCQGYYSKDGKPTNEFLGVRDSVLHFCNTTEEMGVDEILPRHLIEFQDYLIGLDHARKTINQHVGRIKRMIKWACSRGYAPAIKHHEMLCVEGLKKGRSKAREPGKVLPADLQSVQAVLPFLSPPIRGMVQIQYLCGMRPEEVCGMCGKNIQMGNDIWLYSPQEHKGEWLDLSLIKAIPKAAQEVLRPFLRDDPEEYLFRPADGRAWAYERMRKGKPRKKKSRPRKYNPCYCTAAYGRALKTGFELAKKNGVTAFTPFSPNQLRHAIATEIRKRHGQQKAQVWLGHRHLSTTAIYAEREVEELLSVAKALDQQWASTPPFQPAAQVEQAGCNTADKNQHPVQ